MRPIAESNDRASNKRRTASTIALVLLALVLSGIWSAGLARPGSASTGPIPNLAAGASLLASARSSLDHGSGQPSLTAAPVAAVALHPDSHPLPAVPMPAAGGSNWWNISAVSATQPSVRVEYGLVYDAADGYVLMFGGQTGLKPTSETWKYAGGSWTQLFPTSGPSARIAMGLAYDAADGYVVMYGGYNGTAYFSDTWKFFNGIWSPLFPSTHPSPRAFPELAYDSVDSAVILFGGINSTAKPLGDTWRFGGSVWTPLSPGVSPKARAAGAFCMDPKDGYLLLAEGTNNTAGDYSDVWTFVGGGWTQIHPSPAPTGRYLNVCAWDPIDQVIVMTAGVNNTTARNTLVTDTWLFSGGAFTPFSTTNPPDPRAFAGMTWDTADTYALLFWGAAGSGAVGGTWAFAPALAAGATGSPTPTDAGLLVTLKASATGGIAPYSYHWNFGDLATNGSQTATHRYASAGSYAANVTVTDAVATKSSQTVPVVVHALPSVRPNVAPTSVYSGTTVNFTASASNGTPPFTYAWAFGDGASGTGAAPSHPYLNTGNFTVTVTVTDAFGQQQNGTASLHVAMRPATASTSGTLPTLWVAVIAIVVAVAAFLIGRLTVGRRPPSTPPMPYSPTPSAPPTPPVPPSSPPPGAV